MIFFFSSFTKISYQKRGDFVTRIYDKNIEKEMKKYIKLRRVNTVIFFCENYFSRCIKEEILGLNFGHKWLEIY